ncbi:ribose-5-phosphate isomerase [Clostridium sp. CX1]|uniref:Ribose-5-phosphate isomerase n=1 Tax=Clostridium tanneri TaxID=3037988 RepID=A0ABU4JRN4_9CLOT|nr:MULTISPECIES: ribose-5-phosphate isomerase [unclassified Clostridium]MCT8975786.1 ribose-5-phosphate isomerase [Clostridium sp. CX1]MDW8800639.1 ribose-5-phosphate isomerase [Clostridium sp. A1-XYC3]
MGKYFTGKEERYEKIINLLCEYKGVKREELLEILKDQNCKYLFFLLIKRYGCDDMGILKRDFPSVNKNKINNNLKKAEEKLLLNRKIRDMYFEAEDLIEKVE